MQVKFEQPIPGRKVYINRETGTIIGDGQGFTPAELMLLKGQEPEPQAPLYTAEEREAIKRAEEELALARAATREAVRAVISIRGRASEESDKREAGATRHDLERMLHEAEAVLGAVARREELARSACTRAHRVAYQGLMTRERQAELKQRGASPDTESGASIGDRLRRALRKA